VRSLFDDENLIVRDESQINEENILQMNSDDPETLMQ
jgi:hypothetical protein